jgi:putative aldouronate transport system permease protein
LTELFAEQSVRDVLRNIPNTVARQLKTEVNHMAYTKLYSNRSDLIRRMKKYWPVYMIMLPGLIFYLVFSYLPMAGVVIAFKDISPFGGWQGIFTAKWVGLKWFRKLFSSHYFAQLLGNTLSISGLKLLFGFPLPIVLALLLNEMRSMKFKRAVQTVSYLPHFISMVILCGITRTLFSSTGIVNQIQMALTGGEAINFIGSATYFRAVLVIMSVWAGVGWGSIIYLATIAGIDPQLYEAAMVDGAGKWQQVWHITLPGILSTVVIMLIIHVGSLMSAGFEQILLLYSPGVYSVGDIIDTYVYREGLINLNYSYTTAVGLFKSSVAAVLMLGTNMAAKALGQEGIW